MSRIKLPPEEAKRRALERSAKSNAVSKAKRDAEREKGLPPLYRKQTEEQKQDALIRQRKYRAAQKLSKQVRVYLTVEERRQHKNENQKRAYRKKLASQGKTLKPYKTMEQKLKLMPEKKKFVKHDRNKQPDVVNIKANDSAKVKVQLNDKTWVMALPGYNIDDLRKKFRV